MSDKINSRSKGNRGELELSHWLQAQGYEKARRGQQYHGGPGSPDVVGVPGMHIEVKRVAWLGRLRRWLKQSHDEAGIDEVPTVFARDDGDKDWMVVMDAFAFIELWKAAHRDQETTIGPDDIDLDGVDPVRLDPKPREGEHYYGCKDLSCTGCHPGRPG